MRFIGVCSSYAKLLLCNFECPDIDKQFFSHILSEPRVFIFIALCLGVLEDFYLSIDF